MALTNNVFNTKTSNFGLGTRASADALANYYAPSNLGKNFTPSTSSFPRGINTKTERDLLKDKFGYSGVENLTDKQVKEAYNFENKLANNPNFAKSHNAEVQSLSTKAQGLNKLNTPKQSEWSKGAEGKWGTAMAGFDSVVNLTNSVMNWVNMGKQWDYMNKSMDLAEKQFNTENDRYNKREDERTRNNNSIRGAIEGYYTNRANSSAMSADPQAAQAKAAQTQNTQNPQNTQASEQAPQEPQDEERKPLPMERE